MTNIKPSFKSVRLFLIFLISTIAAVLFNGGTLAEAAIWIIAATVVVLALRMFVSFLPSPTSPYLKASSWGLFTALVLMLFLALAQLMRPHLNTTDLQKVIAVIIALMAPLTGFGIALENLSHFALANVWRAFLCWRPRQCDNPTADRVIFDSFTRKSL